MYLHLTSEKMRGPTRRSMSSDAASRGNRPRGALAGMHDGAIDVLATDHAPWTRAQNSTPR